MHTDFNLKICHSFIFTEMAELNLEKLVDQYIDDELPTCQKTPITYDMYEQLVDILTEKDINRQNALTTLIPKIDNDAVVPSNIQNLTRKVRKHLSAKKQKDEIITVLYPTDDPNKISDYCSSAGITKDSLHSTKPISIASAYLTNLLVYDLEKYRQNNSFSWSDVLQWHERIFNFDPTYSVNENTIQTKWSHNYTKINNFKLKKKSKELTAFMKAPYIPPLKQKSDKEKLMETLEHPPLHDINAAADPMLAMAKFQGAVIGTYVQKIEHHNINRQNKIEKLKVTLETVSQEKKVAEKQTVLQDQKTKHLEAELVQCKEKVKYFKPKNVR